MPLRALLPALAAPLLCGCPAPTPETPSAPPPVVEVATAPVPDEPSEASDEGSAEAPPPEVDEPRDEELSKAEEREQEVADALAALTTKSLGGVSSPVTWGTASSSGMTGGLGTLGTGGTSLTVPMPQVHPGKTQVRGSLDKEVIRRVVRKRLNAYQHCYENVLMDEPDLEGKVELRFMISKSGSVARADVTKGVHPELDHCVERVARGMMFPPPKGGGIVIVNYPFVFRANQPKTFPKQPVPPPPPATP